tara:strand:+ start:2946 stop:3314 length:369 start_codon:yes stop_codon:yes gene_type:complete
MITVFYDGKCNLCSKEINYYKKIAPKNLFQWQDINIDNSALEKKGISTSDALKVLHVIFNNNLYTGIDAFIIIWNNISYWKILSKFISLPIIKQISHIAYLIFANWRFNRLEHCIIARNNDN